MYRETPFAPLKSSPVERPILHMPAPGPSALAPPPPTLSEPAAPWRGEIVNCAPRWLSAADAAAEDNAPSPSARSSDSMTVSRTSQQRRAPARFFRSCSARFWCRKFCVSSRSCL